MNAGKEFTRKYIGMMFSQLRDANDEQVAEEIEHCRRENRKPVRVPRKHRPHFSEETFQAQNGFTMQVFRHGEEKNDRLIIYLAGGAFVYQPVFFHWRFVYDLALRSHSDAVIPIYPKAPDYHCQFSIETLLEWYENVINNSKYKEINIIGDSAGGNISLTLAMEIAHRHLKDYANLILLSPCLDLSYQHEAEMRALQPLDTMIQLDRIITLTDLWRGDLSQGHPWASPLFGDLNCVHDLYTYYGTNEILKVDNDLLEEKCDKLGIPIHSNSYDGMFHTFPLFPIPQAFDAIRKMAIILKNKSQNRKH